jgi:xanthine dehydrogenase accessory factor
MSEEPAVFDALAAASAAGRSVVLATIVHARGSVPRGVGSKMVIDPVAGPVGTIGGGCGEAQVLTKALVTLADGQPRIVSIDLTEDILSWSPAICGGIFDVLLERLESS